MLHLFFSRRFFPFFICQFCGALNDNVFRLALVAMLSFGIFKSDDSATFIQLSAAFFMLPFFLLSAAAGDITDALSKRSVLIATKSAEVIIMSIAAAAVIGQSFPLVLLCLFLAGCQSAFFGPLKYALLPSLLPPQELLNGNAWFSISTFSAILLGTVVGTVGGQTPEFAAYLSVGFVVLAVIGLASALGVPIAKETEQKTVRLQPLQSFKTVLNAALADRQIFRCILAGSGFWLLGILLLNELAQMPYPIYTTLLAAVLVGVGIGALLCWLIFRGRVSNQYAPLLLLLGGVLLWLIRQYFDINADSAPYALQVAVALFTASMTLYVVPLRTTIQILAPVTARAKIFAAYNIFNALFIVAATVLAAGIHATTDDTQAAAQTVLLFAVVFCLLAAVWGCVLLPLETVRRVLLKLLSLLFNVRVRGVEHLQEKSTLISNHQSFWDGLLLAVFLQNEQRKLGFPIEVEQSKRLFIRQLIKLVLTYPLNPMQPQGLRKLIREIKADPRDVRPLIFPEGRITVSGNIMKIYPGGGIIAEKITQGKITPIIINGLQHSTLSRMQGKMRLRWFPPVTIDIFPTRQFVAPAHIHGRARRQWWTDQIGYLLEESTFLANQHAHPNLTACFADCAQRFGANTPLLAEFPSRRLTYRQTFTAAVALGSVFAKQHAQQSYVGLLLPSSVGAAVCYYALLFQRMTPVLLNPSNGVTQMLSACHTATLDTVYTSERLLQRSPATVTAVAALKQAGIKVVLLEELRQQITLPIKLNALVAGWRMPAAVRRLPGYHAASDEHASILFTSGSEGMPKGVVLSHGNISTNALQVLARLDVTQTDIMLNALPVFHAFGLLAGVVLPVMTGTEVYQYPSPLHYKMVAEAVYNSNATIFFSTNTFLSNYGKVAHAADFKRLRLVFAGAEKLQDETRQLWANKFGVRLLEGYGVTEASPVLAVNSPLYNKSGTVGRLLPGITAHLQAVESIKQGKRLLVRGDNIMQGYFLAEAPGQLQAPPEGWHDTGDIVNIDDDNYITISGRVKRFIKVAGEMVPLDSVEEHLRQHWQQGLFAAVGIPDKKRGESLVLMTTVELHREDISQQLKQAGLPELWLPREIRVVKEIPLLSTGKVDYPAVEKAFR